MGQEIPSINDYPRIRELGHFFLVLFVQSCNPHLFRYTCLRLHRSSTPIFLFHPLDFLTRPSSSLTKVRSRRNISSRGSIEPGAPIERHESAIREENRGPRNQVRAGIHGFSFSRKHGKPTGDRDETITHRNDTIKRPFARD